MNSRHRRAAKGSDRPFVLKRSSHGPVCLFWVKLCMIAVLFWIVRNIL
jgi:hypothetical protein